MIIGVIHLTAQTTICTNVPMVLHDHAFFDDSGKCLYINLHVLQMDVGVI